MSYAQTNSVWIYHFIKLQAKKSLSMFNKLNLINIPLAPINSSFFPERSWKLFRSSWAVLYHITKGKIVNVPIKAKKESCQKFPEWSFVFTQTVKRGNSPSEQAGERVPFPSERIRSPIFVSSLSRLVILFAWMMFVWWSLEHLVGQISCYSSGFCDSLRNGCTTWSSILQFGRRKSFVRFGCPLDFIRRWERNLLFYLFLYFWFSIRARPITCTLLHHVDFSRSCSWQFFFIYWNYFISLLKTSCFFL